MQSKGSRKAIHVYVDSQPVFRVKNLHPSSGLKLRQQKNTVKNRRWLHLDGVTSRNLTLAHNHGRGGAQIQQRTDYCEEGDLDHCCSHTTLPVSRLLLILLILCERFPIRLRPPGSGHVRNSRPASFLCCRREINEFCFVFLPHR
jgi:hypothetical protein